ncbi:MAG: ABC transporter ATP-binding protein [Desulfovibrio sp.]|jgi:multiple sugar transport system ATP-binding protein|nr:ABC transporter ATP-binding protein [Desulfovibrio sp.]
MTRPKLELISLLKKYDGDVVAVDGINLAISPGETLALLGPSGCGKSTTLNLIVGLEQPSSGDIRVDGDSVLNVPAGKRDIGLVFQDYAVFTSMTVYENLAFGLKMRGVPRKTIDAEVKETARFIAMDDMLEVKARDLGGSELQRVAIGRTLVTRPSILLLDEPLSNLETDARLAMRQELRRLRSDLGLTIIYVTHDQVEALSLADRIAVMSDGKIIQTEDAERILRMPGHTHVAGFLGSPPMNLLYADIMKADDGSLLAVAGALSLSLPPLSLLLDYSGGMDCPAALNRMPERDAFIFGLRAEDLTLAPRDDAFLTGVVTNIEPRGGDCILSLDANGTELKAVAPSPCPVGEQEHVGLKLEPADIFFFDRNSNQRLELRFSREADA